MAPIYTIDAGSSYPGEDATWTSNEPPIGYIWVVRNLDVWIDNRGLGAVPVPDSIFIRNVAFDQLIMLCPTVPGGTQAMYHWEGRTVLESGQYLFSSAFDYLGSVNCTAYQLTPP